MSIDELMYEIKHASAVENTPKRQRVIWAEIHKRIAISFATFVFVLIGLPAAIITRRGEVIVGFSIAMSVVAVYYILFAWARAVAVESFVPPLIALWMPNLIMMGIAFFLFRRVLH